VPLFATRSLRAALATVVVLLLAPLTVLVLEAPAHADTAVGEQPIVQPEVQSRPWGPECIVLPLEANDRYRADTLLELVNAPSFGKIRVYDESATDHAGAALASGDTVAASTTLCYTTNSRFFAGSDSGRYSLVDPAPGHARLTAVLTFQISVIEDGTEVGPAPGPTGLTATAGDGQATLDWDADAAVDTVKVFVDGVIVDTRSVSSNGPLVVAGLTNGLHYAFSVYRPGGALASRPTRDVVPGVVPGAPTDLAAARATGDTVDLSWTAPDEDGDPALTGYRLEYSLDGVPQTPVDVAGTSTSLGGITDDETVVATVTAVNAAGDGVVSGAVTLHPVLTGIEVVAPSTASPGEPVDVEVRAVDATGDTAEWFAGPVQVTSSDATATLPGDTALVDGQATVSVTFADPGTQTVTVTGGGLEGTSDDVTVAKVGPALTLDPSDGVALGEEISADATVADGLAPTGTLTFRAYGPGDATCVDEAAFTSAVTVAGNNTYTSDDFTPATRGDYRWTATYDGDDDNTAASAGCTGPVVVSATPGAPAALSIVRGAGDTVDLEWTAPSDAGHPGLTGYRVVYSIDGVPQTPVDVAGTSTSLGGITDDETVVATVTAVTTAGDGPGSASATLRPVITHFEVDAPVTARPGVPVQVDVRVVDAGGDTATWFTGDVHLTSSDDSVSLPADGPLTDGEGTFVVTFFRPGDQTVTVSGGGVSGTSAAVDVVRPPVSPVVPTLTVVPAAGPHAVGQPLAVSAALAGGSAPTGQVSFALFGPAAGNGCTGTPLATSTTSVSGNGAYAAAPYVPDSVGTYRWTATYSGDAANAAGSSGCSAPVTVGKQETTTTLAGTGRSLAGQEVTLRATIGPADVTGTVVFRDGGSVLGTAVVDDGVAELPVVFTSAGQHQVDAEYSGDERSAASGSELAAHVVDPVIDPVLPRLRVLDRSLVLDGNSVKIRVRCLAASPVICRGPVTLRHGGHRLGRSTFVRLDPGATITIVQVVGRKAVRELNRGCRAHRGAVRIGSHPDAQAGGRLEWQTTKVTIRPRGCNATEGRAYYDRRKAEGRTSMEAMRALKRRLSNIVFKTTLDDAIACRY
jgi:hypothetical protein